MKLKRADKIQLAKDLVEKLKTQRTFLITNYEGLTSQQANELRIRLFSEGIEYRAIKKTIISRVLKGAKLGDVDILSQPGQIALAWGDNGVKLAKIIAEFSKKFDKDMIVAGFLDGEYLAKDRVVSLSKLPSLEILRAQFIGALKATMSGLVNVLNGNQRKLVLTLRAIQEAKS